MDTETLLSWSTIIANIATFTGIIATLIFLFINRKNIWRNKLTEKQLDYMFDLYNKLYFIAIRSSTVSTDVKVYFDLERSFTEFKDDQPSSYAEMTKIREYYREIKLESQLGHNLLMPKEFDKILIVNYIQKAVAYEFFTYQTISKMSEKDLHILQNETFKLMDEIKKVIKNL